jgi:hypothetical protein
MLMKQYEKLEALQTPIMYARNISTLKYAYFLYDYDGTETLGKCSNLAVSFEILCTGQGCQIFQKHNNFLCFL